MGKFIISLFVLCLIKIVLSADPTANQLAAADADALHKALVGLGTDNSKIIDIIPRRTNAQRQLIRKAYTNQYNADLIKDLKGDLSGNYKDVVVALMLEPDYYMAKLLHKMLTSIPSILTGSIIYVDEVLCTKSGDELERIREQYKKIYNVTLEEDFEIVPDDKQKEFLQAVIKGKRTKGVIDTELAKRQVALIPDKPGDCTSTEYNVLMGFFAQASFEQIQYVAAKYEMESNLTKNIEQALSNWCSDLFLLNSYLTVVRYAKNPIKYFAEELYSSMIGLGTKDDKLISIIVSRSEDDLYDIKNMYEILFNRTLASSIEWIDENPSPQDVHHNEDVVKEDYERYLVLRKIANLPRNLSQADTSGHYTTILLTLIERAQPKPVLDVRTF